MSSATNPEVVSEAPEHCYIVTITYNLNGAKMNASWRFSSNLSGNKLYDYVTKTVIPGIFKDDGLMEHEFPSWSFVSLIDFGVNT